MAQMKSTPGAIPSCETNSRPDRAMTQEDYEDDLDLQVAHEAIDEALEKGEVRRARDFAKELGFDFPVFT